MVLLADAGRRGRDVCLEGATAVWSANVATVAPRKTPTSTVCALRGTVLSPAGSTRPRSGSSPAAALSNISTGACVLSQAASMSASLPADVAALARNASKRVRARVREAGARPPVATLLTLPVATPAAAAPRPALRSVLMRASDAREAKASAASVCVAVQQVAAAARSGEGMSRRRRLRPSQKR